MTLFKALSFISIILGILLIPTCKFRGHELSAFDKDVNALINASCSFDEPCKIRIGDATDFEWDEMFVFRPGLLNSELQNLVPVANGFHGEFNRKIAFLRDGKLVRIDEAAEIIEGEHTPPGFLFFDIEEPGSADCLHFSKDAVFTVTRGKISRGTSYRLVCANCTVSPVYGEFGAATQ